MSATAPPRPPAAPTGRGPVLPHPRFRARRMEVVRDQERRRALRWATVGAVVLVLAAGVALAGSPALDVDRVTVVGTARTPVADVRAAAGIEPGDTMATVDGQTAAERVAGLPWVETASVHRLWPGTIRIRVVERAPIVQLAVAGGGWALADELGRVLDVSDSPAASTLQLEGVVPGPVGSQLPAEIAPALTLAADLPARTRAAVASVRATGDGLELVLVDGVRVVFGPPEDVPAKLVALQAMLDGADRTGPVATIDVRVPSAPVLTLEEGHA